MEYKDRYCTCSLQSTYDHTMLNTVLVQSLKLSNVGPLTTWMGDLLGITVGVVGFPFFPFLSLFFPIPIFFLFLPLSSIAQNDSNWGTKGIFVSMAHMWSVLPMGN